MSTGWALVLYKGSLNFVLFKEAAWLGVGTLTGIASEQVAKTVIKVTNKVENCIVCVCVCVCVNVFVFVFVLL